MQGFHLICMLALGIVSASAQASIYGYIDDQGAAHFATEKMDARYQLFLQGNQLHSSDLTTGPAKPALLRYLSEHPNLKKFEPLLRLASDEFAVDPALLKAVMAAESGFNPGAISPKGAIGLMQLMPATAERYGLQGDKNKTVEQKLTRRSIFAWGHVTCATSTECSRISSNWCWPRTMPVKAPFNNTRTPFPRIRKRATTCNWSRSSISCINPNPLPPRTRSRYLPARRKA